MTQTPRGFTGNGLEDFGAAEGGDDGLREAFDHCKVALIEGVRPYGEDFDDADQVTFVQHWGGENRVVCRDGGKLGIDARIGISVVTAQPAPGANTFAGESAFDINQRANWRDVRCRRPRGRSSRFRR